MKKRSISFSRGFASFMRKAITPEISSFRARQVLEGEHGEWRITTFIMLILFIIAELARSGVWYHTKIDSASVGISILSAEGFMRNYYGTVPEAIETLAHLTQIIGRISSTLAVLGALLILLPARGNYSRIFRISYFICVLQMPVTGVLWAMLHSIVRSAEFEALTGTTFSLGSAPHITFSMSFLALIVSIAAHRQYLTSKAAALRMVHAASGFDYAPDTSGYTRTFGRKIWIVRKLETGTSVSAGDMQTLMK